MAVCLAILVAHASMSCSSGGGPWNHIPLYPGEEYVLVRREAFLAGSREKIARAAARQSVQNERTSGTRGVSFEENKEIHEFEIDAEMPPMPTRPTPRVSDEMQGPPVTSGDVAQRPLHPDPSGYWVDQDEDMECLDMYLVTCVKKKVYPVTCVTDNSQSELTWDNDNDCFRWGPYYAHAMRIDKPWSDKLVWRSHSGLFYSTWIRPKDSEEVKRRLGLWGEDDIASPKPVPKASNQSKGQGTNISITTAT